MYKVYSLILILFIVLGCSERSQFDIHKEKLSDLIKVGSDTISVLSHFPDKDVRNYLHNEFSEFYKNRNYQLAWLDFNNPSEEADELLEAIDDASYEGLNPEAYDLSLIENLLDSLYDIQSMTKQRKEWRKKFFKTKKAKAEFRERDTIRFNALAKLDFLMTSAYLTYASHLLSGRIDPAEDEEWYAEKRQKDLSQHLQQALQSGDVRKSLNELAPNNIQYKKLKDYLREYIKVRDLGGFPSVAKVEKGDTSQAVQQLAARLHATFDHVNYDSTNMVFDDQLEESLLKFQYKHSIPMSGELDEETLRKINQPVDDWIAQMNLTMEQLRWVKNDFEGKYVLVNIPAYQLEVIDGNKVDFHMKVIVGKTFNPTPVFSDMMEYVVFRPTWTVPNSIIVKEMLPKIKRNPNYLTSRNFSLYKTWSASEPAINPHAIDWSGVDSSNCNYRVVQGPGNRNALGLVKFIFPNSMDVYLHDTPSDYLFNKMDRNFSHGCIRVEKPAEFASYLLGWDDEKVKDHMTSGETKTILLKEKLPVHVVYWTAWTDYEGRLRLLDDIYNMDDRKNRKLDQANQLLSLN